MTETLKSTFRFSIVWCTMTTIISIGVYGFYMFGDKQTTVGWQMFGALLGIAIIGVPVAIFWMKQLYNLFNIED
jgi:hypothetical protein